MTPDEAIRGARPDKLRPVYVVVGDERVLVDRVVRAVRAAALDGAAADFNAETLTAGEASVERMMNAVRTVPMFARKRFVLVHGVERWESASADKGKASGKGGLDAMQALLGYLANPVDSTCLVLTADKLDGRRKLLQHARKQGMLVQCDPVPRGALPKFIQQEATVRGHALAHDVADLLAEIAGPELAGVLDALDRLSLYVGNQAPITQDDVAACVTRIRASSVWELVGAVANRDADRALHVLGDVYEPQDRGLRLLGVLAWSTRQLLRFAAAYQGGATPEQAAQAAGAPPFKARELAAQVRRLPAQHIENWIATIADADLALKSSRRPPRAVLESAILTMTIGLPR